MLYQLNINGTLIMDPPHKSLHSPDMNSLLLTQRVMMMTAS